MYYTLAGLAFGFLIPYIARRFAKFMPATPGYALWQLFCFGKRVSDEKIQSSLHYHKLRRELFYRSVMSGLFTAVLTYMAWRQWDVPNLGWKLFYFWTLLLLAEIDYRMYLLPDILTVPLLIIGFVAAVFGFGWIGAEESAIGALSGYFLPAIASLLVVWKNRDAFGGGDIKLLAAIGGWSGPERLLYIIILSAVIFLLIALFRQKRSGAYGPAAAVAAIIVAFCFF